MTNDHEYKLSAGEQKFVDFAKTLIIGDGVFLEYDRTQFNNGDPYVIHVFEDDKKLNYIYSIQSHKNGKCMTFVDRYQCEQIGKKVVQNIFNNHRPHRTK